MIGSACAIADGPVDGQAGCAQRLVCAAGADATSGVCVPLCDENNPCEVGECVHCNLDAGFMAYGICLDVVDCDGGPCPVAGCLG